MNTCILLIYFLFIVLQAYIHLANNKISVIFLLVMKIT